MCEGIIYTNQALVQKVYFAHPKATLAAKCTDGSLQQVIWGRRESEPGLLPVGGWANHRALKQGRWDRFFPLNVKIVASEFMVKEPSTGLSNWYSLNPTQFIHGIIAREEGEQRLYIVTIQAELGSFEGAWPRVLNESK
ncbi:MAG: hypothetical protein Q7V63_09515 [Gammaproteobacteria bacterium]|nr:hypothetical protein [Gammaproteobacteria bacterium]